MSMPAAGAVGIGRVGTGEVVNRPASKDSA